MINAFNAWSAHFLLYLHFVLAILPCGAIIDLSFGIITC